MAMISFPVICARVVRLWNRGIRNPARIAAIIGQGYTKEEIQEYLKTRPGYPNALQPEPAKGRKKTGRPRMPRMNIDDRIGLSVRHTMSGRRGGITLPTLPGTWGDTTPK